MSYRVVPCRVLSCYYDIRHQKLDETWDIKHETWDTRHDVTWRDTTRHDTTRPDLAWHDMTWHDTTRHDTTRHATPRHDTTRHVRHDTYDTTRHDTTRHVTSFHFVSSHVISSYHLMSSHVISCISSYHLMSFPLSKLVSKLIISTPTLTDHEIKRLRLSDVRLISCACTRYNLCIEFPFSNLLFARWRNSEDIILLFENAGIVPEHSSTDLTRISSTGCIPCWIRSLAWFWTSQSSAESRLPSVSSYTGCQSENASISILLFWCDIAWSALHRSIWRNCAVVSVQPRVNNGTQLWK